MSDQTTTPLGPLNPPGLPRPRKASPSWWPYAIVAAVLLIVIGCLVWALASKFAPAFSPAVSAPAAHTPPAPPEAPQPYLKVTRTRTNTGQQTTKETATNKGATVSGDADKLNLEKFNLATHEASLGNGFTAGGGSGTGSISAEEIAGRINFLMVLGGLIAAASAAVWALYPLFRKFAVAGLAAGGVLFALGWVVTGGTAMLVGLLGLAIVAGVVVWAIRTGHLNAQTLGKVTRAVEMAPQNLSTAIKEEIGKHSVNDAVIEAAKKAEGV